MTNTIWHTQSGKAKHPVHHHHVPWTEVLSLHYLVGGCTGYKANTDDSGDDTMIESSSETDRLLYRHMVICDRTDIRTDIGTDIDQTDEFKVQYSIWAFFHVSRKFMIYRAPSLYGGPASTFFPNSQEKPISPAADGGQWTQYTSHLVRFC